MSIPKYYFLIIIILFPLILVSAQNKNQIYIGINQVGFLPNDVKTAVLFSKFPVKQKYFNIVDANNKKIVYSDSLKFYSLTYGKFNHSYLCDFSTLQNEGKYYLKIGKVKSAEFKISSEVFNPVLDSLMLFFQVQRCGPTHPLLHKPCHLSDVRKIYGRVDSSMVDLTGGWHDAGDYIKFLSTTSFTTYMLLFSYDFDPEKFGFDNNNNGVPDILEEAKVGLDWMLRCNYAKDTLVTEVQDLKDHEVKWRMPENDPLQYDRLGYIGIGKNQIGIYSAVMALASRIWLNRFSDTLFSKKCIYAALELYSIKDSVPNIDSSNSTFYQDKNYLGKLALGAIELFNSTKNIQYLNDAVTFADSAGSDYWWSWGDINSLADYKIALVDSSTKKYLLNNLVKFKKYSKSNLFGRAMDYTWGTTNSLLGASLQAILYKRLTSENSFDSLMINQRDYILGRNPWQISFIYNIGKTFPKHLHSQIAYFHNGYLPGALTAGPAPEKLLKENNIKISNHFYDTFNTDEVKYNDDRMDFITNEPAIVGNATAVFVFGYFSK